MGGLRPHGAHVGDALRPKPVADLRQGLTPQLGPRPTAEGGGQQADKQAYVRPPGLGLGAERLGALVHHLPQVLGVMLQLAAGREQVLAHLFHALHQFLDFVPLFQAGEQGRSLHIVDVAPEHGIEPLEVVDHEHPEEQVGDEDEDEYAQGEQGEVGEDGVLHPADAAVHGNADEIHAGDAVLLLAEAPPTVQADEFSRCRLGPAVAVQTVPGEAHRPDHEIVFLVVEQMHALPHLPLRFAAEPLDQLAFKGGGLILRVAGIDGHPPVNGAVPVFVHRQHDLARDVGRTHGLDDKGGRQSFVHGRTEHVAHIVLDRVHVHEDQSGLVLYLLLEHAAHVGMETEGADDADTEEGADQAGNEFTLNFLWFEQVHDPSSGAAGGKGQPWGRRGACFG